MALFCYVIPNDFFYVFAVVIIAAFAVLNAPRRSALRPILLKTRSSLPLPPMPRPTRLQAPSLRKVQSMTIWRQLPSIFYARKLLYFSSLCFVSCGVVSIASPLSPSSRRQLVRVRKAMRRRLRGAVRRRLRARQSVVVQE